MKKFAVGFLSFFENDLIVEVVEADNWRDAIFKHTSLISDDMEEWIADMPEGLEEIKEAMFNGEIAIDVKEII